MFDIADAADRQRNVLKATMQAKSLLSTAATSDKPTQYLPRHTIAVIKEDMQVLTRSGEVVSQQITDTFERIIALVKAEQARLQQSADTLHWQQMNIMESRCKELSQLDEKWRTAIGVGEHLISTSSADVDVLKLTGIVQTRFKDVAEETAALPTYTPPSLPVSLINPLGPLQEQISKVFDLAKCYMPDLSKCKLSAPMHCAVGKNFQVQMSMASTKTAVNGPNGSVSMGSVTATVTTPSAESRDVKVVAVEDTSSGLLATINFKTHQPGQHRMEVSCRGETLAVTFLVTDNVQLDPQKCSSKISLSAITNTAELEVEDVQFASVAAIEGYNAGLHSWNVRIHSGQKCKPFLAIGVTTLPTSEVYDVDKDGFFGERFYSWGGSGLAAWNKKSLEESRCPPWEDDDVLQFTLDWDKCTLACYHQRTDTTAILPELDSSKPLYPAVCFTRKGQKVSVF